MAPADHDPGSRRVVRKRTRDFVTRQIAEQTLVVPIARGVGDRDAIYTLNAVAARVWNMLDRPVTIERIVAEITRDFDVSAEEATRDVVEFLGTLESAGLMGPADVYGSEG
jgi:hypothetical protein